MNKYSILFILFTCYITLSGLNCRTESLTASNYSGWVDEQERFEPRNEKQMNRFHAAAAQLFTLLIADIENTDQKADESAARNNPGRLADFYRRVTALPYFRLGEIPGNFSQDYINQYIIYEKYLFKIIRARNLAAANRFDESIGFISDCDTTNRRIDSLKNAIIQNGIWFYARQLNNIEDGNDLLALRNMIREFVHFLTGAKIKVTDLRLQEKDDNNNTPGAILKHAVRNCSAKAKKRLNEALDAGNFKKAYDYLELLKSISSRAEKDSLVTVEDDIRKKGIAFFKNQIDASIKNEQWANALETLNDIRKFDPNEDVSGLEAMIYIEQGKYFANKMGNFREAIGSFNKAKEIRPADAKIQDLVDGVNISWGNELLHSAETSFRNGECKKAYYDATDAVRKFANNPNAPIATASGLAAKALSCAVKRISLVIINHSEYDLRKGDYDLAAILRRELGNGLKNKFIKQTDDERDADFQLVIEIGEVMKDNSFNTYYDNYCTARYLGVQYGRDVYAYYKQEVTQYVQLVDVRLPFSMTLRESNNNIVHQSDSKTVGNTWRNEYWTTGVDPSKVCLCPANYIYGSATFLAPLWNYKNFFNNTYKEPPAIETVLSYALQREARGVLLSFMSGINGL